MAASRPAPQRPIFASSTPAAQLRPFQVEGLWTNAESGKALYYGSLVQVRLLAELTRPAKDLHPRRTRKLSDIAGI
jgi:hypothetical protein